jgi:hypothetical protein
MMRDNSLVFNYTYRMLVTNYRKELSMATCFKNDISVSAA